jgi:hypothetical protein
LNIETLAFATLAILKSKNKDAKLVEDIVKHVLSKRQQGQYGSTQSTAMALKMLAAYQELTTDLKEDGSFVVMINNKKVIKKEYKGGGIQKISIKEINSYFKKGKNTIKVKFTKGQVLPFSLDAKWMVAEPRSHRLCPLVLASNIRQPKIKMGETARLDIQLKNTKDEVVPSPMAVIGIPAGLSLQPWQLKKLQEEKVFDYYEIKDNYLILYYSELDANAIKNIALDLKTEARGVFSTPANSTYMYYTNEYVNWTAGQTVSIQ